MPKIFWFALIVSIMLAAFFWIAGGVTDLVEWRKTIETILAHWWQPFVWMYVFGGIVFVVSALYCAWVLLRLALGLGRAKKRGRESFWRRQGQAMTKKTPDPFSYPSGQFTTNKDAAAIIRRFVKGTGGPYEWDDLESIDQTNPDVDIAINLCWYYAAKFPAANKTEYCGRTADKFFLKIADALEEGRFAELDRAVMKRDLQSGRLPDPLHSVVEGGSGPSKGSGVID